MSEHDDWVRFRSFEEAAKLNRFSSTEKIIDEAAKISAFIMGKPRNGYTANGYTPPHENKEK